MRLPWLQRSRIWNSTRQFRPQIIQSLNHATDCSSELHKNILNTRLVINVGYVPDESAVATVQLYHLHLAHDPGLQSQTVANSPLRAVRDYTIIPRELKQRSDCTIWRKKHRSTAVESETTYQDQRI